MQFHIFDMCLLRSMFHIRGNRFDAYMCTYLIQKKLLGVYMHAKSYSASGHNHIVSGVGRSLQVGGINFYVCTQGGGELVPLLCPCI